MKKQISIITPVFNSHTYLPRLFRSIENVCCQSLSQIEIIIVDDGSTDSSLEIISDWTKVLPIEVYCHAETKGVAIARNKALQASSGKWIYFLDSDDTLLTDVSKIVSEKHNWILASSLLNGHLVKAKVYSLAHFYYLFTLGNFFPISSHIIRKDLLSGLQFDASLKRGEDWLFWFTLLASNFKKIDFLTSKKILSFVYSRNGSLSSDLTKMMAARREVSVKLLEINQMYGFSSWCIHSNLFAQRAIANNCLTKGKKEFKVCSNLFLQIKLILSFFPGFFYLLARVSHMVKRSFYS